MTVFAIVTADPSDDPAGVGLLRLLRNLHTARRDAGGPTYRVMSEKCGLSPSTICRIFTAKTKPPSWENLARVLSALGATPDNTWHQLWVAAQDDANPIAVTVDRTLLTPGREHCPRCGTWIANATTHRETHQHYDQLTQHVTELEHRLTALTGLPHQRPHPDMTTALNN